MLHINCQVRLLFLLTLLLGLLKSDLYSQKMPGVDTITLHSGILKEDRTLYIYTPPSAKTSRHDLKYPVLFLFDAETLFLPLAGAVNFMNHGSSLPQIPECFIVGIPNTNRSRDMPVPQEIKLTNGAENFYQFLASELLPYMNGHYDVSGLNVLIGHSQGGLFVTYSALKNPAIFPFILALDAPIDVNPIVQKDFEQQMYGSCKLRYFSAERLFGWSKDFPVKESCLVFSRHIIEDETHETMPYKGMYEGLKFLFKEYLPVQKDLSLPALKMYYQGLAEKYNCKYDIPSAVLLNSAREKIGASKKNEAIAILLYHDELYGTGRRTKDLLAKANAISREPDARIDNYLNAPSPAEEVIKPFLGKWAGTVFTPGGSDMSIRWEIKNVNGRYTMVSRINDDFNSSSDFLLVPGKNELIFGRKHNGGGIYLSEGKLSGDGSILAGTEDLIGFDFPKDFPAFQKNKFEFKKVAE